MEMLQGGNTTLDNTLRRVSLCWGIRLRWITDRSKLHDDLIQDAIEIDNKLDQYYLKSLEAVGLILLYTFKRKDCDSYVYMWMDSCGNWVVSYNERPNAGVVSSDYFGIEKISSSYLVIG